jgi:sugar phosphate isomerase/epimerase
MTDYRISFQLYSARNFPPIEAQLEALAAIGFDAVEPYGGAYVDDPAGFRKKIDAVGLNAPTAHMGLDTLDSDRKKAIAMAQTLGLETVVVPAPPPNQRSMDGAGWRALAQKLREHAAALAEKGLKLAWHNHNWEYAALADGTRPIDILLGSPGVLFEPDIGWIVRGGANPDPEIRSHSGRIAAFHIKDVAPAGVTKDDGWTDIGAGTIDWKKLWPAISASGCNLLVFENDAPSDWRSFAAHSYSYVAKLIGRG